MSKLSTPITETVLIINTQSFAGIHRIQPQAAGLDIGAHEIWVCVPGEAADTQIIRLFGTYTADLHAIGAWLQEHQIRTVAMESTGVYWIPIFEYLEALGFQCCLISSRSIKRVPGRNAMSFTDGKTCLVKYATVKIERHSKVSGEKSPYDGDWLYWGARLGRSPMYPKRKTTLLKRQQGKCHHCGLRFIDGNVLEVHHRNGDKNDSR